MTFDVGPNLLQVLTLLLTVVNSLGLAWLHVRNSGQHGKIERAVDKSNATHE